LKNGVRIKRLVSNDRVRSSRALLKQITNWENKRTKSKTLFDCLLITDLLWSPIIYGGGCTAKTFDTKKIRRFQYMALGKNSNYPYTELYFTRKLSLLKRSRKEPRSFTNNFFISDQTPIVSRKKTAHAHTICVHINARRCL